jgi:hypothetical protein
MVEVSYWICSFVMIGLITFRASIVDKYFCNTFNDYQYFSTKRFLEFGTCSNNASAISSRLVMVVLLVILLVVRSFAVAYDSPHLTKIFHFLLSFSAIPGMFQLLDELSIGGLVSPKSSHFLVALSYTWYEDVLPWMSVFGFCMLAFELAFSFFRFRGYLDPGEIDGDSSQEPLPHWFDLSYLVFSDPPGVDEFTSSELDEAVPWRVVGWAFLIFWLIFSIVIMLNLLSAALTETFQSTRSEFDTMWKVIRAKKIRDYQIIAEWYSERRVRRRGEGGGGDWWTCCCSRKNAAGDKGFGASGSTKTYNPASTTPKPAGASPPKGVSKPRLGNLAETSYRSSRQWRQRNPQQKATTLALGLEVDIITSRRNYLATGELRGAKQYSSAGSRGRHLGKQQSNDAAAGLYQHWENLNRRLDKDKEEQDAWKAQMNRHMEGYETRLANLHKWLRSTMDNFRGISTTPMPVTQWPRA